MYRWKASVLVPDAKQHEQADERSEQNDHIHTARQRGWVLQSTARTCEDAGGAVRAADVVQRHEAGDNETL
jgi:hypothetical protein